MPQTKGDIYVAKESFQTILDDGTHVNARGGVTRVREGHPLLAKCRHLFEPQTVEYDIEQATSAPGEKRG